MSLLVQAWVKTSSFPGVAIGDSYYCVTGYSTYRSRHVNGFSPQEGTELAEKHTPGGGRKGKNEEIDDPSYFK